MKKVLAILLVAFPLALQAQTITTSSPVKSQPYSPSLPQLSIAPAPGQTGAEFQTYDQSGNIACYFDSSGMLSSNCRTTGTTTVTQVNGTDTLAQGIINFQNGSPALGLTLNFFNPSAGNIQGSLSGILTVAGGGTGTSAPSLNAGQSISISGSWPNQTVSLTGIVPIDLGGTGAASAFNAFNALAPSTNAGGLIVGSGTNTYNNLPLGSVNSILTSTGSAAAWSSSVTSSLSDTGGQVFNVKAYGATGDAINRTDGAITSGASTLTSPSSSFITADVNKYIVIFGAGASGAPLITTISSVINGTTVVLAALAGTTVTSARFVYGTIDLVAVNNASNALNAAGGGVLYFPPGGYILGNVSTYSNEFVRCAGPGSTILYSPASGNFGMWTFSNASNVGMFNCQMDGLQVGSSASGYNFAFENVQRGWFVNNYSHDGGTSDLGIDINGSFGSSGIYVLNSIFTDTHNEIIATIQTGDGASDIHFLGNTINENMAGQLMFGGDGITNSVLADDTFYGTTAVSAGIQLEATSHNVANVQLSDIKIEGVGGSQSAILLTETGSNSISNITGSNIQLIDCGRGFSINNFNGNGSGTVSDISINGLHAISTSTDAAVYIWNHAGGTFQNIHLSGVTINGCGLGDGNGCFVLSGPMTGVQLDGAQILNVPSGAYPIYQTTISNPVSIGNVSFSGGTGALTNQYSNLLGFMTGNVTPSGTCETGAFYSNTSGSTGTTAYVCVAGSWVNIK